jgi:WD40 repeat protein
VAVAPDRYGLYTVALSPDGRVLATAGRVPVVSLVEAQTGMLIRELPQEDMGALARLEFSPDGRTLVASGYTGIVTLWDVATGTGLGSSRISSSVPVRSRGKALISPQTEGGC